MEMTIDELSTLMLGISDNTATDMLHGLAGRSRIDGLHGEYGHQTPEVLAPQLNISEQFHLFFSFPASIGVGPLMIQAKYGSNYGIFVPNFRHCKRIVPQHSKRIKADPPTAPMSWMQRLNRSLPSTSKPFLNAAANCASSPVLRSRREALADRMTRTAD